VVDLDPDKPEASADALIGVLRTAAKEDVITLRDSVASAARLIRTERAPVADPAMCAPTAAT